jgi:tRNA nucleotidyltransferase/poly(A) polymerase
VTLDVGGGLVVRFPYRWPGKGLCEESAPRTGFESRQRPSNDREEHIIMSYINRADQFMASLGVEVYAVGGRVRDELLGREPKDADYTVFGESLRDLRNVLEQCGAQDVKPIRLRQGGHFGWRFSVPSMRVANVEVTLPRTERSAGPGRAMEVDVDPNLTLEQDAERRDFTFNALYRRIDMLPTGARHLTTWRDGDVLENVIDPTGRGLYDLERRIVNTTHAMSFRDDPLRMLRALRFVARGFSLGTEAERQMTTWAPEVDGLTAHGYTSGTLLDELRKILAGAHAATALRAARDTGVLAVAIPELAPMLGFEQSSKYHDLTTDEHTFTAIETACKVGAPLRVRFALLFHDAGKPEVAWYDENERLHYYEPSDTVWEDIMENLHASFDGALCTDAMASGDKPPDHEVAGVRIWRQFCARVNAGRDLREDVATLIKHHMLTAPPKGTRVRRLRVKLGDEMLRDLIMHRACDISGKGKKDMNSARQLGKWEDIRADAARRRVPGSVKELQVSGKDAISAGLEGRAIGAAMRDILDEVVCQPDERRLSREWQLERLEALA